MMSLLLGLLGSSLIAGLAYWKRSLSGSGFAAAVVVGTALYAAGSLAWFGTLIAFFLSSTLLSKFKGKAKAELESAYEKSGRRDAGQVFANGGLAVLLCLGNLAVPHPAWWAAFVGVMATVNADTWATEVGGLSRTAPRSILSGRQVPPGTSGAVSGLGLAATVLGGLFIGLTAWLLLRLDPEQVGGRIPVGSAVSLQALLLLGTLGGTLGSLADSLLGARWQLAHRCTVCGKEVEVTRHCGEATRYARGFRALNNDAVNLLSSVIGGAFAALLAIFFL